MWVLVSVWITVLCVPIFSHAQQQLSDVRLRVCVHAYGVFFRCTFLPQFSFVIKWSKWHLCALWHISIWLHNVSKFVTVIYNPEYTVTHSFRCISLHRLGAGSSMLRARSWRRVSALSGRTTGAGGGGRQHVTRMTCKISIHTNTLPCEINTVHTHTL